MLTYKHHVPKDRLMDKLERKLACPAKFIRCAHESADNKDPYDHTHVLIWSGKRNHISNARWWDVKYKGEVLHPNMKPVNSNRHWDNSKVYLAKEDVENVDLKDTSELWFKEAKAAKSLDDAVRTGKANEYPARSSVFRQAFIENLMSKLEAPELTKSWQIELEKMILQNPADCRKIHWIFDKIGNTGKTNFVRAFSINYPKETIVLTSFGGQANVANLILNSMEKGITPKYIFVDLPRTFKDRKNIVEALEVLKNGMLSNTKYLCQFIQIYTPTVVVFANFCPYVINENESLTMSWDRWDICELIKRNNPTSDDDNLFCKKITFEMAKSINKKLYLEKNERELEKFRSRK